MNEKDLQLLEDARMEAWHKGDKEEFDTLGKEGKRLEDEDIEPKYGPQPDRSDCPAYKSGCWGINCC